MTRKDYIQLAAALADVRPDPAQGSVYVLQWLRMVDRVGDTLMMDNPRFDRSRFETACGVEVVS